MAPGNLGNCEQKCIFWVRELLLEIGGVFKDIAWGSSECPTPQWAGRDAALQPSY